jgi:hypothetical protein
MARLVQLLVLCAAVTSAAVTPKLKWGQDKDFVYLKVAGTKCGGKGVDIDSGVFKLACGKHALDLSLREDLDTGSSVCKSTRNGEECKLKKKHSHLFDRLTIKEDGLKGFGSVDFENWEEEKEEEEAADPMAAMGGMAGMGGMGGMGGMDISSMMGGMGGMGGAGKGKPGKPKNKYIEDKIKAVRKLTYADIQKENQNGKTVVAHAFYPWCAECDKHQEDFGLIASQEKENYVFGWVDMREERELSRKLSDLGCDSSCSLRTFSADGTPGAIPIDAAAGADAMRKALLSFTSPLISPLADENALEAFATAAKAQGRDTAVGFFADESDSHYADFKKAAGELRAKVAFAAAFGEALSAKRDTVPWLLVEGEFIDPTGVEYDAAKAATVEEVAGAAGPTAMYISMQLLPMLQKYSYDIGAEYDAFKIPTLQVGSSSSSSSSSYPPGG